MTTTNLPQFQLNLQKFADSVPDVYGALVKKIAFELFKRIVEKTPVDTGRARANWSVEVGPAASEHGPTVMEVDKDGTATITSGGQKINTADVMREIIWLTNNLPYIEALENGHSGQAPAGMVEGSLNEIQHYIDGLKTMDWVIKSNS